MKYDGKFKLQYVRDYKKGKWTDRPHYAKCSERDFHITIRRWVRIYDLYGVDWFKQKQFQKDWTPEERYELVARVLAGRSIKSVTIDEPVNLGSRLSCRI